MHKCHHIERLTAKDIGKYAKKLQFCLMTTRSKALKKRVFYGEFIFWITLTANYGGIWHNYIDLVACGSIEIVVLEWSALAVLSLNGG